ncbi:hypothetical protein [Rhodoblastus sp.]|uniref:hypothetical protein n=1 Tax=Rhodoblastus sp. TaxID=1962975 RepID=UPI0025D07B2F|nr:hypothetical protein [Rhodoblastus sp.]
MFGALFPEPEDRERDDFLRPAGKAKKMNLGFLSGVVDYGVLGLLAAASVLVAAVVKRFSEPAAVAMPTPMIPAA